MINMTEQAFELVEELFSNKVDKGGHPYIQHLLRVSSNVKGKTAKTVALLHDVIEDTNTTKEDLIKMGFLEEVVEAVDILSRKENETYNEFILRIISSNNPLAIRVKIADLEDNMDLSRISNATQKDIDRVNKRYKPAYESLTKIAENL